MALDWFDQTGQEIGVDPALLQGNGGVINPGALPPSAPTTAFTPGEAPPGSQTASVAPGGAGAPRLSPSEFIKQYQLSHPAGGGIQPLTDAMKAAGYNVSRFMYGNTPSNNELSIDGGGKYKVMGAENSDNPYWYEPGTYDGPAGGFGGGYGGYGGGQRFDGGGMWAPPPGGGGLPPMPTAPTVTNLQAPGPFQYQGLGNLTQFQSPGNVPGQERLGYNPLQTPTNLQVQQVGQPQSLSYNPLQTPTAYQGGRQADPASLQYQSLNTPGQYSAQNYTGLSAADLQNDPSYQFRLKQGLDAIQNSAASKGVLRTGNTGQALIDYGQQAASQEYAAADARARQNIAQNNQAQLAGAGFNAQTGLAYNQNANQNALNFGNQNIQNQFAANEANYGRGASEAQQGFTNQFNVGNANNSNALGFGQANISNQLNAAQANNQANLGFGAQNWQQALGANQANNQGQNAATQQNNANALAAQGQQFGQAAQGYGLNLGAQQQGYGQALGAYGQNAQTGLAYGSQNQQNALANYQAQTNAALGLGNLNLGYTQAANQYALGNRNVDLGYTQAGNQFALGQGNLDLTRQFGTYDRNYQSQVTDPWNQQFQLSQLGKPK